jgi:hypothetical protein
MSLETKNLFKVDTGLDNDLEEPLLKEHFDDESVPLDYEGDRDRDSTDPDATTTSYTLFSWLDHFCFLLFVPALLLLHYHTVSLQTCEANIFDNSFFCTIHKMSHHGWNYCIPISVVFFIISIYMYKISLFEVAPCMFLWSTDTTEPKRVNYWLSTLYQSIASLPEIALITMFSSIIYGTAEISMIIMLSATSAFSFFTILVTLKALLSLYH